MVGGTLAALGAGALVAIGAGALVAPGASSRAFGMPASGSESLAFVRALGVRDIVLGMALCALLKRNDRRLASQVAALCALLGIADLAVLTTATSSPPAPSAATHAAGAVAFAATALLLRLGR